MKYAVAFALVLAVSFSAVVPTMAMKKATTALTSFTKATPAKINEENVRFCGSYTTGCVATPMISTQMDMTILGMMHRNPIYLEYPVQVFAGAQCSEETAMLKMTMSAPMKEKNGIEKTMILTPEKYTVVFMNEAVISGYKCTTPLELNVEYDVSTLDCKDEQGEDPFAEIKASIGKDMESPMVFGENDLVVRDPDSGDITLNRESDVGCTCAKNLRA